MANAPKQYEAPDWGGTGQPFTADDWQAGRADSFAQGMTAAELARVAEPEPEPEQEPGLPDMEVEVVDESTPLPATVPTPASPNSQGLTAMRVIGILGALVWAAGSIARSVMVFYSNAFDAYFLASIASDLGWLVVAITVVLLLTRKH